MPSTASLTPAASILSTERVVATTADGATVSVLASGLPVSNAQAAADAVVLASAATDATTKANAAQAAAIAASAQRASNLSDLANAATARTNLGLGNVDNTSDANKPVSTATQTALDGKADADLSNEDALNALAERAGSRSRFILFGDSITAQVGGPGLSTGYLDTANHGWFTWVNIALGHRLVMVTNAGKGGDTAAGGLARISAEVLAYDADYVTVMFGTNDAAQSRTFAAIIADLTAIYTAIRAAGMTVIAIPPPPRTGLTGPQQIVLNQVRRWVLEIGRLWRGVIAVDMGAAIADQNTNYQPASLMLSDGVHPLALGAYRMGVYFASQVERYLVPNSLFTLANGDGTNLLGNATFYGTGTSAPGTWSFSGSPTWSYIARTDFPLSNWAQAVAASGCNISQSIASGFSAGQFVYAALEFECDNTSMTSARLFIQFNGVTAATDGLQVSAASSYGAPARGVFMTRAVEIPVGTTSILFFASFGGSCTLRLGRALLRIGKPDEVTAA